MGELRYALLPTLEVTRRLIPESMARSTCKFAIWTYPSSSPFEQKYKPRD
jgi:hypothetical protein